MWRFTASSALVRADELSQHWLATADGDERSTLNIDVSAEDEYEEEPDPPIAAASGKPSSLFSLSSIASMFGVKSTSVPSLLSEEYKVLSAALNAPTPPRHQSPPISSRHVKIEVGVFGGHMNNHAVGQTVLRRILALTQSSRDSSGVGNSRDRIRITLLALPLLPDTTTTRIALRVAEVVNLPAG
jgi:hypothetical protein